MQICILWSQVFASPHKLLTVGLRGLDELGHPTAGTFSVSHIRGAKVKRTCTGACMLAPDNALLHKIASRSATCTLYSNKHFRWDMLLFNDNYVILCICFALHSCICIFSMIRCSYQLQDIWCRVTKGTK